MHCDRGEAPASATGRRPASSGADCIARMRPQSVGFGGMCSEIRALDLHNGKQPASCCNRAPARELERNEPQPE